MSCSDDEVVPSSVDVLLADSCVDVDALLFKIQRCLCMLSSLDSLSDMREYRCCIALVAEHEVTRARVEG